METDEMCSINSVFLNIYSEDELRDIAVWLYTPTVPDRLKFDQMNKEGLLEAIGYDIHVLCYEMEQERQKLYEATKITPQRVYQTLEQLGIETHYLMEKLVIKWNEDDYANYRVLSQKAGNPVPVFGIYDSSVREEDKYLVTTPPSTFYPTEQEAVQALSEMIRSGQLEEGEAKVMML